MKWVAKYAGLLLLIATMVMTSQDSAALTAAYHGDSIRVSLVTFYPGSDVYELFGHSEIRVTSPAHGDTYFNYGVFDFNAPNFVYRFVTGETDYWCVAIPPAYVIAGHEQRKLVEQELNITQKQARVLDSLLVNNARYGNNTYRYKYFSDNCATRPRDMVERAIQSQMTYDGGSDSTISPLTFRSVMRHFTANYPWEQFGIDIVLGSSCDTLITWRQAMFVPMILRHAASQSTITTAAGVEPLVKREITLVDGDEAGNILPATPFLLTPVSIAILVLIVSVVVTFFDIKRKRQSRWLDFVLLVFAGIAGCLITFLITMSSHEAVSPNYNILWLNPLLLVMAVLIWFKRATTVIKWLSRLYLLAVAAIFVVWLTGLQVPNYAFIPLAVAFAIRAAYTSFRKS